MRLVRWLADGLSVRWTTPIHLQNGSGNEYNGRITSSLPLVKRQEQTCRALWLACERSSVNDYDSILHRRFGRVGLLP